MIDEIGNHRTLTFDPGDRRPARGDHEYAGTLIRRAPAGPLRTRHLTETVHWEPPGSVRATTWDCRPDGFTPIAQTDRSWLATAPQTEIDRRFHTIVTDLVGTPTHLIDPDGGVTWHTQTTIWGTTVAANTTGRIDCPLRYPGQYHDPETGHHYNNQPA